MESQIPDALLELIDNEQVTDICISTKNWMADQGLGLEVLGLQALSELQLEQLARDLVELGGRRLDQANPFADVSLPGGLRVHAVLKSSCSEQTLITIRLHKNISQSLDQLLIQGFATNLQRELILEIANSGSSFLITGATGTGKTTLLRSMLAYSNERVIACEDVTELSGQNIICLQSRLKNIESAGEITLEDLVRQALRMRPDRLCIGEVRGPELLPMLQALNTGHRGATTLHANSLAQVPERLISISSAQQIPRQVLNRLVLSAFDWVISLGIVDGARSVTGIGKFELIDGQLHVSAQLRPRRLALA